MHKVEFCEVQSNTKVLNEDYRLEKEREKWVLTLARGECRTAGYDIHIKSVTLKKRILTVLISLSNPAPGSFLAMVITFPTRKYVLELIEDPVKVIFQLENGEILKVLDLNS